MTTNNIYQTTAILLIGIPALLIIWKIGNGYWTAQDWLPETTYQIECSFNLDSLGEEQEVFVKTFLPESNRHQTISNTAIKADELAFQSYAIGETGQKGEWRGQTRNAQSLNYSFECKGQAIRFVLPENLPINAATETHFQKYLEAEEYIQSDHLLIKTVASNLAISKTSLNERVKALYDFVYEIPSISTNELTDALTTLRENQAS